MIFMEVLLAKFLNRWIRKSPTAVPNLSDCIIPIYSCKTVWNFHFNHEMSHIFRGRQLYQSEMESYKRPKNLFAWECCKVLGCLILTISFLPSCATENTGGIEDSVSYGYELTELFRLGDESRGDTILFGSIGELVAVDGSGRIFIGEQQDPIVYVLDTDGGLIKTIGREGSGPGAFYRLSSIHIGSADTLYIFDYNLGYLSVYEPEGLELAYSIAVSYDDSLGKSYSLVGTLDTGYLFTYGRPIRAGSPSRERRMHVLLVTWAREIIHPPVHSIPAEDWLSDANDGRVYAYRMHFPIGRETVLRMGPKGNLYAGWTESIDIEVVSPDGIHHNTVTHSLAPVPLTRQEIKLFAEEISEGPFDWSYDVILAADLPATKPAFETFVVDDLERIWIKTTSPSVADTARWLILDQKNELKGEIRLPKHTNLRVIRHGRAYAIDDEEENLLVVYQIREQ